jgi:signal peptidase I
MNSVTERIANLPIQQVIAIVVVLFVVWLALRRYKSGIGRSAAEIVESALIAIVLVFLVIRPFLVQAFFIPSESMEPTLLVGDRLLVNKLVYRFKDPQRGDIVVFKSPPTANEAHSSFGNILIPQRIDRKNALFSWNAVAGRIKGVYGSDGEVLITPSRSYAGEYGNIHELCILGKHDSVGVILPIRSYRYADDGYDIIVRFVGINKSSAAQELVGKDVRIGEVDYIKRVIAIPGDTIEIRRVGIDDYAVYLNGKAIKEPYIMDPPDYERPKLKIPEGMYYVMGDNRRNSNDSHEWGLLDRRRIVGKAMVIFWPPNRIRIIR